MGANEARHVLEMTDDMARVVALEIYTAAQALDYRRDMINAARGLAAAGDAEALAAKVHGAPLPGAPERAAFLLEVEALRQELAGSAEFQPGRPVSAALVRLRRDIAFMDSDRAMDAEVALVVRLVEAGEILEAARAAL
jgi:histidine ammonia-lyase